MGTDWNHAVDKTPQGECVGFPHGRGKGTTKENERKKLEIYEEIQGSVG